MNQRWVLLSLAWLALLASVSANQRLIVADMDMHSMRETVNRFSRMVVLMHDGSAAVKAFQPWLYALAQAMPQLRFARIDVAGEARIVADTFGVTALPAIKIFQRDLEAGKRVVDYTGPLEFDPLLEWCEAMVAGCACAIGGLSCSLLLGSILNTVHRSGDPQARSHSLPAGV